MLEAYEAALVRIARMALHAVQHRAPGQARGWVLAQPALAARPVPPADITLATGHAVASDSVADATPWLPIAIRPDARVHVGQALPKGCDAVLPPALVDGAGAAIGPLSPGTNVRRAGSAAQPGAVVAPAGTCLGDAAIAALCAAGIAEVAVRQKTVPATGAVLPFGWLAHAQASTAGGTAIEHAEACGVGDALVLPQDLFGAVAGALALGLPLLHRLSGLVPPSPTPMTLAARVTSPPGLASVVLLRAEGGTAHPLPWGSLAALAQATHFAIAPSASEGWAGGGLVPAQAMA